MRAQKWSIIHITILKSKIDLPSPHNFLSLYFFSLRSCPFFFSFRLTFIQKKRKKEMVTVQRRDRTVEENHRIRMMVMTGRARGRVICLGLGWSRWFTSVGGHWRALEQRNHTHSIRKVASSKKTLFHTHNKCSNRRPAEMQFSRQNIFKCLMLHERLSITRMRLELIMTVLDGTVLYSRMHNGWYRILKTSTASPRSDTRFISVSQRCTAFVNYVDGFLEFVLCTWGIPL